MNVGAAEVGAADSQTLGEDELAPQSRRWGARLAAVAYPLLGLGIALFCWDLVTRVGIIPAYLVPSPGRVLDTVWSRRAELLFHASFTAQETIAGFLLSAVVGIGLSLALFSSRTLNAILYPLLVASQSIPRVAIAPLFVVWMGFGLPSKIIIAFLMAFFPVVISTSIGLQSVPREMILLAQSMGAGWRRTFWKIRVPHALPNILGGLKVSITLAVVGAVVGEFVGADRGLGYLVHVGSGTMNISLMFAAVVSLVILGLLLYLAIEVLEYLLVPPPQRLSNNRVHE
jgi:NitT/TauT family transport system permease protein